MKWIRGFECDCEVFNGDSGMGMVEDGSSFQKVKLIFPHLGFLFLFSFSLGKIGRIPLWIPIFGLCLSIIFFLHSNYYYFFVRRKRGKTH